MRTNPRPTATPACLRRAKSGPGGFFNILPPGSVPDNQMVCGLQSSGHTENGGVYQTFTWTGGEASISVAAYAYSVALSDLLPDPTGCEVRMEVVPFASTSRDDVSNYLNWVEFAWGPYWGPQWNTQWLDVESAGTYTLFIEGWQPTGDDEVTTLSG